MTDDDWVEACDEIMLLLVDAGCGGCTLSANTASRELDVTLWNRDVEIVAELLSLGLEARRAYEMTKAYNEAPR